MHKPGPAAVGEAKTRPLSIKTVRAPGVNGEADRPMKATGLKLLAQSRGRRLPILSIDSRIKTVFKCSHGNTCLEPFKNYSWA